MNKTGIQESFEKELENNMTVIQESFEKELERDCTETTQICTIDEKEVIITNELNYKKVLISASHISISKELLPKVIDCLIIINNEINKK